MGRMSLVQHVQQHLPSIGSSPTAPPRRAPPHREMSGDSSYPYAQIIKGDLQMAQSLHAIYDRVGDLVTQLESRVERERPRGQSAKQLQLEAMVATRNEQIHAVELERDKLQAELRDTRATLLEQGNRRPSPSPRSLKSPKSEALQQVMQQQQVINPKRALRLDSAPSSPAVSPKSITQRPGMDDSLADDETEDDDELSLSEDEETEDEGASPPHSAVSSLSPSLPPPPKQVPKPVARYSEGGVNGVGKLQVTIRRGRMKESSTAEDLYIKFRRAAAGVWHIGEWWWQV